MSFLLESVEGGAVRGRYSIIGLKPDLVWRANGTKAEINRQARTRPDAFEPVAEDTLASLRKLAAALNCELHYALVPKTSLAQHIENRAQAVATEQLRPIAHSMALEDQAVASAYTQLQIDQTVKALLEGSRRELW